jgi:polyhydroxyalkanoate synthesis regulator phasin
MTQVETIEVQEEAVERRPQPLKVAADRAHKTMLAGIGMVAIAQDEAESVFDRLVSRGEEVEKTARERIKEMRARREEEAEEMEEELDTRIERILHRMNMPTQSDVKALNSKINVLNDKIEELLEAERA